MDDVVVIGSGPAGLTAAMYTARAELGTKVVTGALLGGQVSLTWEIDNYPGLPNSPHGSELIELMTQQVTRFGAELVYDEARSVDFSGRPLRVICGDAELVSRAVIVACGARARKLGVPGEREFVGRGVSYCATCDGAFFRERDVIVVGGGDSALEEALFLTRYAHSVRVVHRRDSFRAGVQLQKRALSNDKVQVLWNSVVDEIQGAERVERAVVRNVVTGETGELPVSGVFVFIGHEPNSQLFRDVLALDEQGYVKVDEWMATSVPGVFAAGEIMDSRWRQVATSVGQGCAAGMSAVRYLSHLEE